MKWASSSAPARRSYSGWLPEPLRLVEVASVPAEQKGEAGPLPEFLTNEEQQTSVSDEDRRRLEAAE